MQEMQVHSLGQEDPLEKEMATHSISCLRNPMHRKVWQATDLGSPPPATTTPPPGAKNWTQLSNWAQYSVVWIFILFIHSSADRHLGCFYFGAIMNNSVTNVCIQLFAKHISHLSDTYLGIELLGLTVAVNFFRNHKTIFQTDWTISHSHHQYMMVLVSPHSCLYLWLSFCL